MQASAFVVCVRTHTETERSPSSDLYALRFKNLQQLFTFWTIFMLEIGFGIGVRTKCLILDVTSAELPTDLLLHARAHQVHRAIRH